MAYFKSLDTSSYKVTTNTGRYLIFAGSEIKEITDLDEIRFFQGNTNFVECDAKGKLVGDNTFAAYLPDAPEAEAASPEKKSLPKKESGSKQPKKKVIKKTSKKKVAKKKTTKRKTTKKKKKDTKDTDK